MPVLANRIGNAYAHISYLVYCERTKVAAAIDPFHVAFTLRVAREHDLTITQVINTHEHWDHCGRNARMRRLTGARILAPRAAQGSIETIDVPLAEGDRIAVGESESLTVLETPGHTMTHICLLGGVDSGPYLLSGDTLFGAGVGNCGYGGHAPTLFETTRRLAASLRPQTVLYPGHDYLSRNLDFALHVEPGNGPAAALRAKVRTEPVFTTLDQELEINPFLRLDNQHLRKQLQRLAHLPDAADERAIFLALRQLRDAW